MLKGTYRTEFTYPKTNNTFTVYENPKSQELDGIETVRFIADDETKTIYAWNGEAEIHSFAAKTAGLKITSKTLLGSATKIEGKWTMTSSESMSYNESLKEICSKIDWDWIKVIKKINDYLK